MFSTTFRREAQPASAFGANLLGATVGGFAEYLGMVVGSQALSLLVIACYLCSYLVLRRFWGGEGRNSPRAGYSLAPLELPRSVVRTLWKREVAEGNAPIGH